MYTLVCTLIACIHNLYDNDCSQATHMHALSDDANAFYHDDALAEMFCCLHRIPAHEEFPCRCQLS